MEEFFKHILDYFNSGDWKGPLESIRSVVIFINFGIILFGIWVFFKSLHYRPRLYPYRRTGSRTFAAEDVFLKEQWGGVMKRFSAGTADSLKLAIIEADKLADDTLKKLGVQGEHMADRLEKVSPEELRTLDRLWRAHRLRNQLVHTPGFEIDVETAKRVLADYQAFLEEIGLLPTEELMRQPGGHH